MLFSSLEGRCPGAPHVFTCTYLLLRSLSLPSSSFLYKAHSPEPEHRKPASWLSCCHSNCIYLWGSERAHLFHSSLFSFSFVLSPPKLAGVGRNPDPRYTFSIFPTHCFCILIDLTHLIRGVSMASLSEKDTRSRYWIWR